MKKILALILTVLLLLSLCACGSPAPTVTPSAAPVETAVVEETPAVPDTSVTVNVYRGDDNAEYVYAEPATVSEITPENLISALTDAGVFTEEVTVNSFSATDSGCLNLDLSSSFARQLSQFGTAGEYIMMGSLVNTFLDAYAADGIYVTVDGETLESGHAVYDSVLIFYEKPNM